MDLIKEYNEKELTITVKDKIDTTTDFTDLKYISSAGLRVLVATGKKLKPKNIPYVIKVNDTIKEILVMSGFDKILNIE